MRISVRIMSSSDKDLDLVRTLAEVIARGLRERGFKVEASRVYPNRTEGHRIYLRIVR